MTTKQITIIGGHGQMGTLFAHLFNSLGHGVYKLGESDWKDAQALVQDSHLVIICVPIELTRIIIERVAPLLKGETILADFTSIKVDPLMAMLQHYNGPVLGLHPMFGPTITSPKSQVIINCPGRKPEACEWLLQDFRQLGFTLKTMNAGEHDQAMGFIQGVEHFITFALGTFLHHKQQSPAKLLEIASPIYLTKLLLLGRIFDQDPKLYAEIIMANPERVKLIAEFVEWLAVWVKQLQAHNKDDFIAKFMAASKWMGDFTVIAQEISDQFLNIEITHPLLTKHN